MKSSLTIFAKRPVAGRVKTRLTPPLSPEEAAELYSRMLQDTLAKAGEIAADLHCLFYDDEPQALPFFQQAAPGFQLAPQKGANLGERMANAFASQFSHGIDVAAIIGSDSPHLPAPLISEAIDRLQRPEIDVVFGPSTDGGYYLVAMKRLHHELFREIPWSTGEVLRISLERAAREGIRVYLLRQWHDVDTAEDLQRKELLDETNGAPMTRGFLTGRHR